MTVRLRRLGPDSIANLPATVQRHGYDRDRQRSGIVHLGPGAFHRAHQACYTDTAMQAGDAAWMITGISLRSADVAERLAPQRGLYTVVERDGGGDRLRVVGALREVLVAPRQREQAIAALASPDTRVVTLTVTEKGYCRNAEGGLDLAKAGPGSIHGLLAAALAHRRDQRLGGLTLISCDNLASNGRQLAGLLGEYLDRLDPLLRAWFERECRCPGTMVDRIVPATTAADLEGVAVALGVTDTAAVVGEPFTQWVIEDRFAGPRPRWELAGAQFTDDVGAWETAKLRLLNGAHSALAYIGLARGHRHVHEAMADPALARLVRRMMIDEAAPTLPPVSGLDVSAYIESLLARFANPALAHRLEQIAMDGSQKLPQRWLATLADRAAAGARCPVLLTAVAAWLRHVRGDSRKVDDPLAAQLAAAWRLAGAEGIVEAVFGPAGLLPSAWQPTPADVAGIRRAIEDPDRAVTRSPA